MEDELHGVANLAQDEIETLQKKGYQEHEAREVALTQLILLPPEEDEDDEQSPRTRREGGRVSEESTGDIDPDRRAQHHQAVKAPGVKFTRRASPVLKQIVEIRPIQELTSNQPGSRHSCSLHMTESLFSWSALSSS